MQGIRELGKISNNTFNEIESIIKTEIQEEDNFNKSLLYSAATKEKLLDENERKSFFKIIKNKQLFDCFQNILDKINENDDIYNFYIYRNDITFIKYGTGGFFKSHTDYLSVTSNFLEEYTLILCLDANCKGGETKFEISPFFDYKSKSTTTKQEALLFRKDLCHEGCLIEEGYKYILTANVIGVQKNCGKIIVITFNKEENKNKKCILKYSDIHNIGKNLILNNIKLCNKDKLKTNVIEYIDEISTYEEFQIIEKIYKKYCISYEDYLQNKNLIKQYILEEQYIYCDKKLEKNQNLVEKNLDFDFTQNIILCGTEEKFIYCVDLIIKEKHNYVPFMIIYTEGYSLNYCSMDYFHNNSHYTEKQAKKAAENNSDLYVRKYPLKPYLTCFGENNAILHHSEYLCIENDNEDTYKKIKNISNLYPDSRFKYGLETHKDLYKSLSGHYFTIEDYFYKNDEQSGKDIAENCLNVYRDNYKQIEENLCKYKLYDYIEKKIKKIEFNLPQHNISASQNLCNESVYENINILIIYGALNIDEKINL
jgi:hypothetical protein